MFCYKSLVSARRILVFAFGLFSTDCIFRELQWSNFSYTKVSQFDFFFLFEQMSNIKLSERILDEYIRECEN